MNPTQDSDFEAVGNMSSPKTTSEREAFSFKCARLARLLQNYLLAQCCTMPVSGRKSLQNPFYFKVPAIRKTRAGNSVLVSTAFPTSEG